MTDMDTSGFYKLDGELLFGPNFVLNANYELYRDAHDQCTYPVDGWYWFDNESEARAFFGLPPLTASIEMQPAPDNAGISWTWDGVQFLPPTEEPE